MRNNIIFLKLAVAAFIFSSFFAFHSDSGTVFFLVKNVRAGFENGIFQENELSLSPDEQFKEMENLVFGQRRNRRDKIRIDDRRQDRRRDDFLSANDQFNRMDDLVQHESKINLGRNERGRNIREENLSPEDQFRRMEDLERRNRNRMNDDNFFQADDRGFRFKQGFGNFFRRHLPRFRFGNFTKHFFGNI